MLYVSLFPLLTKYFIFSSVKVLKSRYELSEHSPLTATPTISVWGKGGWWCEAIFTSRREPAFVCLQ